MLLNPSILALLTVSAVVTAMLLLAGLFAIQIIRHWDISSGSERQLNLERRTYLISTIVAFSFVAELVSLLLFVYNAEQISSQFVGAMCATGVLNVNSWGWPTLNLKIVIFFAGAAWLILNRSDNRAIDYPLVRKKYGLLLLILPLVIAETVAQTSFFLQLNPDVITSCCGSLFTPEGEGVAAEVSAIEPGRALILLSTSGVITMLAGGWYLLRGSGGPLFATATAVTFVLALVAIVSCISLYIYEHPHHHCPFCILKGGHGFIGYYLYIPLFISTASAIGAGIISPFSKIQSLSEIVPADSHRLVILSMICMLLFYAVATYSILSSNLTMMDVWWNF
jgi:phosphatidylglycerophosphate synthase